MSWPAEMVQPIASSARRLQQSLTVFLYAVALLGLSPHLFFFCIYVLAAFGGEVRVRGRNGEELLSKRAMFSATAA